MALILGAAFTILSSADRAWSQGRLEDKIQLLGAISRKDNGVALVKDRSSKKVQAFRVGQKVFSYGTLLSVSRHSIQVREPEGVEVSLFTKLAGARGTLPPESPEILSNTPERYAEEGFERIGNSIRVDSAYRDRMVSQELPTILMSAASEPVMQNGKIIGFRLFQFEPGSIFTKIGLQEGDVIEAINGVPLNNVARTVQFLNGLKSETSVEVSIQRDGRPVQLKMEVN